MAQSIEKQQITDQLMATIQLYKSRMVGFTNEQQKEACKRRMMNLLEANDFDYIPIILQIIGQDSRVIQGNRVVVGVQLLVEWGWDINEYATLQPFTPNTPVPTRVPN